MEQQTHPWGHEIKWASTEEYSGRIFVITEGERMPYIYHKKRDKSIFVLQGIVQLVVENRNKVLNEGDSYHIPPRVMHRLIALKGDATILEAGTKLTEDVVVVEDDYSSPDRG